MYGAFANAEVLCRGTHGCAGCDQVFRNFRGAGFYFANQHYINSQTGFVDVYAEVCILIQC